MCIRSSLSQWLRFSFGSRRHLLFSLSIFLCLLTFFSVTAAPLYATGATVTNTNDSGPGSLRQAIADAAPGDTIVFDASLSGGTIVLSETLTIDKALTLDGTLLETPITVSSIRLQRVLQVNANTHVTLTGFTIADSYMSGFLGLSVATGSGLLNDGTAVIDQITFSNNSAGGSYRNYGDGGAISNRGAMTITNSTFIDNNASVGGAIVNHAQLVVQNSTFISNYATRDWGGGDGGAIYNAALLTITNSTFYTNQVGGSLEHGRGGGMANSGTAWVYNSTFSDNQVQPNYRGNGTGGGIINTGTLHMYNTIIANSADSTDCDGTLTTNVNNLIEDGSCSATITGDPNLGPLADNGGATLTHALLRNSPAIDAGDAATCLSTDQRGVVRPIDGNNDAVAICDIGAYEAPLLPPIVPGDGNGDGVVDAGDLSACVLEIFDGDGTNPTDAAGSSYPGTVGCDANGDAQINAGDLSCTVLLIFNGPGSCGVASGGSAPQQRSAALSDGSTEASSSTAVRQYLPRIVRN